MMARIGLPSQPVRALGGMALAWLLILPLPGAVPATGAQSMIACASPAAPATPAATPVITDAPSISFPEEGGELTVFAAASLTDAFTAIATDLEAEAPRVEITFNFAGSQALATQLAEGARADVFAPANESQLQAAIEAGLIAAAPVPFVLNRLAVVVPSDNPAGIETPADLAQQGAKLVLAQPEVPAGRYAREAICAMAADAVTYGDDFAGRIGANVVSEEEDVRGVLTRIELGEADAGIVYVSDAIAADDAVTTIEIPDEVNVLATYPVAPVEGGDETLANAFVSYLLSPEGQMTLRESGFEPIARGG